MHDDPRTPAEHAFLGFAKVMISQLAEGQPRKPLPLRSTRTRKFDSNGDWEWEAGHEPDLPHLFELFDLQTMGRDAPELFDCVQSHYRDGLLPIPGMSTNDGKRIEDPSDDQLVGAIIHSLIWPFWHACAQDDSIEPSEGALVAAHRKYFSESYTPLSFLPLQGLKSFPECLSEVESHIKIVPATPEWKTEYQWIFEYGRFTKADLMDLGSIHWMIRVERSKGDQSYLTLECRDLLTAIRLASNGKIGVPVAIADSEAPKPRMTGAGCQPSNEFATSAFHSEVQLSDQQGANSLEFYNLLQELRRENKIEAVAFALRRYNLAFGRESAEDAFVDLVIASEAVLLRNNKDQLAYRFQIRGTALMARQYPPEELARMLKGAYDIRSGLVHGSYSGTQSEPGHRELNKALKRMGVSHLNEALDKLREVAGHILSAVLEALKDHQNIDQFLQELDREIVARLNPES